MPSPSQPIICFGEILLRLAAQPPSILFQDDALQTSFCGAEANVAVALAGFGHHARMVSVVADNPVGAAAKSELRRHGVDIAHVAAAPGRMGLYYLSPGAMARPAHIVYDRDHSAFATLHPAALDWHDILQGAGWLFISGINAALGEGPLTALRQAMTVAREVGVRIAFDCNYRASLWAGREHLAPRILCELASASDLVFAGRRAISMLLGKTFDNPDADIGFRAAAAAMFAAAPTITHIAATRREIASSDAQKLTAHLAWDNGCAVSPTVTLDNIIDRIGTGDAFASGIIHGQISAMTPEVCVRFGLAAMQWKHGIRGDFLRASVADISALAAGTGGDVRR